MHDLVDVHQIGLGQQGLRTFLRGLADRMGGHHGVPCAREGGAEGTSGAAHTDHAGAQANTHAGEPTDETSVISQSNAPKPLRSRRAASSAPS